MQKVMSTCIARLVEHSKFKKTRHARKEGVPGLISNLDSLLYYNKLLNCQKNSSYKKKGIIDKWKI